MHIYRRGSDSMKPRQDYAQYSDARANVEDALVAGVLRKRPTGMDVCATGENYDDVAVESRLFER